MRLFKSILTAAALLLPTVNLHAHNHKDKEASSQTESQDIVELAKNAGQFSTLLKAAEQAGLVDTLKKDGPITVFAPTDEAFSKVAKAELDSLLKPENKDKLQALLKYHVVAGNVMTSDLKDGMKVATLEGGKLEVDTEGAVEINDAKVVKADLKAKNGVVHVVDSVLMKK